MTIATTPHSELCSFTYPALSPQPSAKLTIIVPAFNEEAYLPSTLDSIHAAAAQLRSHSSVDIDTIVVDNNSRDQTAAVARGRGARVVREPVQGIARARNAGARHAEGDVLVFYLRAWRVLGRLTGMVQGATQFCRRSVFEQVGGYDEKVWIGEDVDFYWGLKRFARRTGRTVRFMRESARAALLPSLRQVTSMEDPGLDQPSLHLAVPPLENGLEGLVLACGAVGLGISPSGIYEDGSLEGLLGYRVTNDVVVSEFTITVYSSPGSKSGPSGTSVSTMG